MLGVDRRQRGEVRAPAPRRHAPYCRSDPVVAATAENLAKCYLHQTRRFLVFALLALIVFLVAVCARFPVGILPGDLSPTAGTAFVISGWIWSSLFNIAWQGRRGAKRILAAKPQPPDPAATPAAVAVDSLAPGEVDIIQR
ncbi:hypothetical protein [Frankia sp. Cas3]|uniref:hypothetical protein n=1 Tax=Frankia sp. Cas3 TaxID=3073926 RepID=UPI002AD25996|nr:hypothetical protein [Frankia sp. Cas3]